MASSLRRARSAGALLLVLALGLLTAGCGGDDVQQTNTYVDEVNRIQTQFAATFERLAGQLTATSTAARDRRTLDGFQKAIEKTVADLERVEPPEKVTGLHQQLTDTMSSYGDAVRAAEAALAATSVAARATAQAKLAEQTSRASADFNRTVEAINRKLRE